MRKLVRFFSPVDNGWLFGTFDGREITLPSGYTMPVTNGYVFYRGYNCQVLDIDGNPIFGG